MSLFHSLKFKVLIGTAFLFFSVFALYSYLVERSFASQVMDQVLESASRVSDVIKKSTRYSMLLNRRPDVYQIIATMAMLQGESAEEFLDNQDVEHWMSR